MTTPTSWVSTDIEKQELAEQVASPTEGSTTLAEETPEPDSKIRAYRDTKSQH